MTSTQNIVSGAGSSQEQVVVSSELVKSIANNLANALKQDIISTSAAYSVIFTIAYTDAQRITVLDNGLVYDQIELFCPSTNTAAVYAGGANPTRPIAAGSSMVFRKKRLHEIYIKGTINDVVYITC